MKKIDPTTIDWEKFKTIFPYLSHASEGGEPNKTDICPVCGAPVDHFVSLLHIGEHGKDPHYGIDYRKALDALVYIQIMLDDDK